MAVDAGREDGGEEDGEETERTRELESEEDLDFGEVHRVYRRGRLRAGFHSVQTRRCGAEKVEEDVLE